MYIERAVLEEMKSMLGTLPSMIHLLPARMNSSSVGSKPHFEKRGFAQRHDENKKDVNDEFSQ